ncbi:hypothetical protein CBR_g34647 [Chara braunii]|uniref:HAT C-terminal dimerisation domain-containing protein n=1 Tax=Chara braunii TaxID=69332 RepID=A0A388LJE0_CHABU|nr:hypothetical protein CBR_g34647 [Chara braunii]|eukprot:GBG82363.1 hypothetical protein CBR_g34647 [Chara braunii]
MDFVHSKRMNKLSPESFAKLVYIHKNMQLLRVPYSKNCGFVDLWCDFVKPFPEPEENDGSLSKGFEDEAEKTEEEFVRELRFTKTPKGRVPKIIEDEDEELTNDSDLDDELWKRKCGSLDDSSGSEDQADDDFDFELRPESAVLGTTQGASTTDRALEVVEDGEEEDEEHQPDVGDNIEQEEEAEGMVQLEEGAEMEHQEEEEGMVQGGEEEEMQQDEEGDGLPLQEVQHGEVDQALNNEPHLTATTVYTRRPRPAECPELKVNIPEFMIGE